jgi:hypothetical protein
MWQTVCKRVSVAGISMEPVITGVRDFISWLMAKKLEEAKNLNILNAV